ncbi:MAG: DUF4331 domain-containing protein [Polyangiaceae bacterium]
MPKTDSTDFYMFNSYEAGRTNYVTLIADYQPFQDPFAGPNYFTMDPEALYEIHIDNTGDGQEDLTFQFRFQNTLANNGEGIALQIGPDKSKPPVAIPLVNAGPLNGSDPNLGAGSAGNLNVLETYSVNVIRGNRRTGQVQAIQNAKGGTTFIKPTDNIGKKTFPAGYDAYAKQFMYDVQIPGCAGTARIFAGQRQEPFAVNVGVIFDLIDAPLSALTNPNLRGATPNPLANKNISSIAMEVPTECLRTGSTGKDAVIGGWQSASLRQARALNPQATYAKPDRSGGAWTQVSRLGMPLTNEVVIGLKDKDRWNVSEPKDDAQFAGYVARPTMPQLIQLIFGAANAPAPTVFPRLDLAEVFLTGVPGVNANGSTAKYQRLNTSIPATPQGSQNNLGALQCFTQPTDKTRPTVDTTLPHCDPAGFPNGRRPGDDIVDIELMVLMGRLLDLTEAPTGGTSISDTVLQDPSQFDAVFPYLKTPLGGS